MYTPRVFEVPHAHLVKPSVTPRTSRKFIQDSLDLSESIEFPTPVFGGKIIHHDPGQNRKFGNLLGTVYVLSGVFLATWALYSFVIDSSRTLMTQLYLVSNRNTNLKNIPTVILLVSLLAIVNGCFAFSKKICVRFIHFMLTVGVIGFLVYAAVAMKRGQPELEQFFRKDALRQLQEDYGILPEVTHGVDFIQVRFGCCGLQSPQNFDQSQWKRRGLNGRNEFPKTCFELKNADMNDAALNPVVKNNTAIHRQGCLPSIYEYLVWDTWELVACLCGTGLVMAVNMFLSCKYVR
ncbi:uncharacterized protein LOC100904312 [Galendromus occidentalis]|uniref:Uncharacterized protein LOC100904312 n=1 Tax=Galendromus occidentalis TaxID=34638 RepID=A0AAJ6QQI2_9ACAR|nr:uncharacterized protein LOC100904312 [Galendromus occidentalis]